VAEINVHVHDSAQATDSATVTLRQVVREVVTTSATTEDLQTLIRLLAQAQEQNLDRQRMQEQIAATPFAGLRTYVSSQGTANILAVLNLVIAAIALVVAMRTASPDPTPTITPQQVEQIVERVVDSVSPDAPPDASPNVGTVHPGPEPK
jgi:hypothetical protein